MIRRTFFKWATAAAVTAIVEIRNFGPVSPPFAGGVELEPGGTEVYEERISTVLGALDAWNVKRVAVQGACETSGRRSFPVGLVCARGTHGCTVVHPAFYEAMYSAERWAEAEEKWVLDLRIRDGEKREVENSVDEELVTRLARYRGPGRRRFFGRAFVKGKQFDWPRDGE